MSGVGKRADCRQLSVPADYFDQNELTECGDVADTEQFTRLWRWVVENILLCASFAVAHMSHRSRRKTCLMQSELGLFILNPKNRSQRFQGILPKLLQLNRCCRASGVGGADWGLVHYCNLWRRLDVGEHRRNREYGMRQLTPTIQTTTD